MGSQINIGATEWEKLLQLCHEIETCCIFAPPPSLVKRVLQWSRLCVDCVKFDRTCEDEAYIDTQLRQSLRPGISDREVVCTSLAAMRAIIRLINDGDGGGSS